MQRVWSTYLAGPSHPLDPNLRARFTHEDSVASSRATSARRLFPGGMNFNNNSSVDDYPSHYPSHYSPHYTPSRRRHFVDDNAARHTPKSKYSSNAEEIFSAATTDVSLTINFIPSKFSEFRNRKGKYDDEPNLPKSGGGIYAFRSNEPRMPQGKSLRWNKFKWVLFATNTLLTLCSLVALIVCLLTWFDVWEKSPVVRTGNAPELILSTLTALIGLLTSLIGWAGILLNNRGFLAWYTFLTWVTFAFLVSPGYLTYKRRTFNLEGKINLQWSRHINPTGRLLIQNQLNCCGYFSPYIEATVSQTCYARSLLPGCKGPYMLFEKKVLSLWYRAVLALVPAQLLIMVAGLLSSNNITYRFGKGMMPEAYRLNSSSMSLIVDKYAEQLAEQYGADIANTILKRNRSNSKPRRGKKDHSRSRRNGVPVYPFKSKYGQQSNPF